MNTKEIQKMADTVVGFEREYPSTLDIDSYDDLHDALMNNLVVELKFFNTGPGWDRANMQTLMTISRKMDLNTYVIIYEGRVYVDTQCIGILDSLGEYVVHPNGIPSKSSISQEEKEARQQSKNLTFGMRYGITGRGISDHPHLAALLNTVESSWPNTNFIPAPYWKCHNGEHIHDWSGNKVRRGKGHNKFKKGGR